MPGGGRGMPFARPAPEKDTIRIRAGTHGFELGLAWFRIESKSALVRVRANFETALPC